MRNYVWVIQLLLALLMMSGCSSSEVKGLSAKVLSVTDGDTLTVRLENGQEEKVRLTLIDTPETKHPNLDIQPFGEEASAFTTDHLRGKDVELELDVQERDQYGRVLAYVWLGDTLFNEVLIEKGYARMAVFPPNIKYVDRFKKVQKEAAEAGIGIWSIENYVQEDGYHPDGNDGIVSNDGDCVNQIKGNKNSKIYHLPTGEHYNAVREHNIVWFCSEEEAEKAGYRAAKR